MSGQWPPEWDDPEDIPGEADQQDTEAEAGLAEVAAYLASVPAPVMPGSVEARISAALAVESAARAGLAAPVSGDAKGNEIARSDGPVLWDEAVGVRVLRPASARARVRRRGAQGRRGQRDVRKVLGQFVIGPLAVCLLIVVIALGLSHAGNSSSSSSANSLAGLPAAGAASTSTSAPAASAASAAASAPVAVPSAVEAAAGFVVSQTGTRYQRATLAQQARAQVIAAKQRASASASSPSSAASAGYSSARTYAPTSGLRGCVLKVTGGVLPEMVDRATYQGTPAYVIASSSRVWVVGLGCSAARTQVIASVPLAG